jgi:uncharacterized protein (TIGR04222 family)
VNFFDLPGPQFLQFFFLLAVVSLIVSIFLRWFLRGPGGGLKHDISEYDPLEVAYLAYGEVGVVNLSLAKLFDAGALQNNSEQSTIAADPNALPTDCSEIDKAIFAAAPGDSKKLWSRVKTAVDPIRDRLHQRLEQDELVLTRGQRFKAVTIPLLLMLLVVLIGVIKIGVGIYRIKPVEILAISTFILFVVSIIGFGRTLFRTRHGEATLADFQTEQAALQVQATSNTQPLSDKELALAVALFGLGTIYAGKYSWLANAQRHQSGSSCGSGCSSGCGGGGGCGGGCGGCGGGGD